MLNINKKKLIVIVGPTASGKTSLSISIAQKLKCSIISADSRQFYREMNIGTAKPTPEELSLVPHFFINNLSVTDSYSVGNYVKEVNSFMKSYFDTNDKLIIVGGSGLFIDGITKGLDNFPSVPLKIRNKLNLEFQKKGLDYLTDILRDVDREYYCIVDLKNPRRVIRALEIYYSSNKPYSYYLKGKSSFRKDYSLKFIGLNPDKDELHSRITSRVHDMIKKGLVDEVKKLYKFKDLSPLQSVGYSELFKYLDNEFSLDAATELIKLNTRKYSKKQLTWFKKNEYIKWYKNPYNFSEILTELGF